MLILQYPDGKRHREDVRGEHGKNTMVLLDKVRKEFEETGPRSKRLQMDKAAGVKCLLDNFFEKIGSKSFKRLKVSDIFSRQRHKYPATDNVKNTQFKLLILLQG